MLTLAKDDRSERMDIQGRDMNTARRTDSTKPAAVAPGTSIATEFTTTMIDQVFAAGVILESAAKLADGRAAARLQHALDELDALVRDTRATAFGWTSSSIVVSTRP